MACGMPKGTLLCAVPTLASELFARHAAAGLIAAVAAVAPERRSAGAALIKREAMAPSGSERGGGLLCLAARGPQMMGLC